MPIFSLREDVSSPCWQKDGACISGRACGQNVATTTKPRTKGQQQKQVQHHPNPTIKQQSQTQPQANIDRQSVLDSTESLTGEEDEERSQTVDEATTTAHGRHRPSPLLLPQWKSSRKLLGSTRDIRKNSLDFESSLRAVPELTGTKGTASPSTKIRRATPH